MPLPHLRDLSIPRLAASLRAAGVHAPGTWVEELAVRIHQRGARTWKELGAGRRKLIALRRAFAFGPLLEKVDQRVAADGTRKWLFAARDGAKAEVVRIRTRTGATLCLSSQAGCVFGCRFCATARLGLIRHLTAGEITESALLAEADGGPATDVVFMGQGEPLHNYGAVLDACTNLNHDRGRRISRRRITLSTVGITPAIRRYARERRPWRLHLSLHAAVQETRERLMPAAHAYPLPDLLDAMRELQRRCKRRWLTLQYVALPGVNLDERHVDALGRVLEGLRAIVNVIPFNGNGRGFRPPSWAEVKEFTTRLRRLEVPVKIRYSAGKREGMGCGQLAADRTACIPATGHLRAPPGIFTG